MKAGLWIAQRRVGRKFLWLLMAFVLVGCAIAPEEISTDELLTLIEGDNELITQYQIAVRGPLSLGDIMARAVLTNLDQKVSNLEESLAMGAFELSRYDMLPSAALSSTYYDRNNENASRSISVLTRRETLEPSTSQENERAISDLRVSWNLLDFGVSYFQAKQEADRYLIAGVNRKKAFIDLMQQARTAYWRALAAQRLREPVAEVISQATVAYQEVNQGIEERIYPNLLQAMQTKKELFTLIGDLEQLQSDLDQSMILLANFINVPSDTRIVLAETDELPALPELNSDVDQLELTALANSSEVLVEAYNARIEHAETRKALLRLLPGLELGHSFNNNTNDFLYNKDWNEASVRVSWNLLRLASTRHTLRSSDLRNELQIQRRLAANMAVVTRLNLSVHQYNSQLGQLETARELQEIDAQIAELTANAASSDADSQVNQVRAQAESITAQLSFLLAYAQVQEAYGSVMVSLGLNPLPMDYRARSIEDLSQLLADTNDRWYEGEVPLLELN